MTSQATSMPLSEFLQQHGVEPAEAARLGAQGDAISANRGLGLLESAHPEAQKFVRETTPAAARTAAADRAELQNHLATVYQPPRSPSDYVFPALLQPENDQATAADTELRAALHSEGLPRQIVEAIGQTLAEAASKRTHETAEQATARQGQVREALERFYGRDTDANLRLVDGLLDRLLAKGGATRDFVSAVAPHLDALSIDNLVQFAKSRAGRR